MGKDDNNTWLVVLADLKAADWRGITIVRDELVGFVREQRSLTVLSCER